MLSHILFYHSQRELKLPELKSDASLYDVSVALTANAKMSDRVNYKKNLSRINELLAKSDSNSFKAWMLGRVALAALQMNDEQAVNAAVQELHALLPTVAKDEYRAWALGYLAAINSNEYAYAKEKMLPAAKELQETGDALWAHVMNLQAAAMQRDRDCFDETVKQMTKITGTDSVSAALIHVSTNDWRAWAFGITLKAAATLNRSVYNELIKPTSSAIDEAIREKLISNALLAQLDMRSAMALSNTLSQEEQPRLKRSPSPK